MHFFKTLFNKNQEQKSAMLERIASWEISPLTDAVTLFRNLNIIIPENSKMYFEEVYDNEVKAILKIISDDCKTILSGGTLWPKPDVYHVPATEENYKTIQEITKKHPISVHFHIHQDSEKILEWYDAFDKDPMYISKIIDEEKIKEFCDKLNLTYKGNKNL